MASDKPVYIYKLSSLTMVTLINYCSMGFQLGGSCKELWYISAEHVIIPNLHEWKHCEVGETYMHPIFPSIDEKHEWEKKGRSGYR